MSLEHGTGWAGADMPLTQSDTALNGSALRSNQITK